MVNGARPEKTMMNSVLAPRRLQCCSEVVQGGKLWYFPTNLTFYPTVPARVCKSVNNFKQPGMVSHGFFNTLTTVKVASCESDTFWGKGRFYFSENVAFATDVDDPFSSHLLRQRYVPPYRTSSLPPDLLVSILQVH